MTITFPDGAAAHMTRVSPRRQMYELPGDGVDFGYISVWVDDVQIAAAVHSGPISYDTPHYSLWSSALSLDNAKPLRVNSEHDARAWLALMADLAEQGPRVVEKRHAPQPVEPGEECRNGGEHDWAMTESGYTRQWSIEIDDDAKVIRAFYGGSEDFSEEGAGDEHLECLGCLAVKPLPAGYEVDYE
jgi:hypothetical protein